MDQSVKISRDLALRLVRKFGDGQLPDNQRCWEATLSPYGSRIVKREYGKGRGYYLQGYSASRQDICHPLVDVWM